MTERQKQKEEARRAREEVKAKLEQDRREREEEQRASMFVLRHAQFANSQFAEFTFETNVNSDKNFCTEV